MNFVKLIIITLFLVGCSVESVKRTVAPVSRIELNVEYVMRMDTENPWYDGSQDIYVIPREIKKNWVRYEYKYKYNNEGVQRFYESSSYDFLVVFDKVEE